MRPLPLTFHWLDNVFVRTNNGKKIKASAICSAPTTFDFNDYYLKVLLYEMTFHGMITM